MPRSARLTDIRRQERLSSPYHLTSAGQEGHDERHDSLTIAPHIRLSSIRRQARQAMRPTNITTTIPIDGVQQNSTVAATPIVIRRRTREASHPTNTTPAIPIDGVQKKFYRSRYSNC
ncbi:hypothetical protein MKW98_017423 [Papaver atlanticum]|uniref:Uncharacterized protein n=1 Tax=Papaver atlanticum TaxID=357466 RepID=A0AAD4SQV5_9MAGN|nr:hypothetical protein MKW98_017423 [Papaver atlanticum]